MEESRVTEYILQYMKEHHILSSTLSRETGISEEKLVSEYKEALLADEFLRLCVYLKLSPEEIAIKIHDPNQQKQNEKKSCIK